MRVLYISYGFMLQRAYQWKARALQRRCEAVYVLVPDEWREHWSGSLVTLEPGPLAQVPHSRARLLFNRDKHFALLRPAPLRRLLRDFRPNVVEFDNEPYNLGSGQVVAAVRRHAPDARVFLHAAQNILKRYPPPFNAIERYVFRHCGGVFARNVEAHRILEARGLDRSRIQLLGHGVSLEEFAEARRRQGHDQVDAGAVLYVGALTHQKGVDTLLRAFAATAHCTRLTIVGDGPLRAQLQQLADDLGVRPRVHFVGRVDQARLADQYASHGCLVLPSRTTPKLVEQFGRVLLEAMAAGCPVVASDSGNIPRVVGDAGIIFPEDDTLSLARHLDALAVSPQKRAHLRECALARVRSEYEWSVQVDRQLAFYEAALSRTNRELNAGAVSISGRQVGVAG